ncbi:hypothetical protein TARUN_4404 [Trichoderma arundinaceum]|uniref:F-box domain-containing protein n=1 Tax=Trichoderma arundinaceum TaxID=490622 RepID=A0A395NP14_TRIAR|nr:hypothetical protein TARUN_4404 [Trichoderma arundinaceum]
MIVLPRPSMAPSLGAPSAHSANIESSSSRFIHHYPPYHNYQHQRQPLDLYHHTQPQMDHQHQHQHQHHHQHGHNHPHRRDQQPQSRTQQIPQQHQQYHSPQLHPSSHHRQHSRTMTSLIERLPQELQKVVFSHLDYQALIHLSTMNRYFYRTIDPQRMADPADKAQFVMRAAKDFPQHRPSEKGHDYKPGNFECYICFRVRSPDHFDMLQPQSVYVDVHGHIVRDREPDSRSDKLIMLRRFCISCGVESGIHAPFDCLTTRTGRDLWVCNCRKVWSKPGCLRCPDCQGDCPLRPRRKLGVDRA